jgi:prepilin-type N-terminal cleavage/methylation domain-containing protein
MKKSKIPGYTIIELIVVMVISTIVVSIAYKTYDIVFTQYLRVRSQNEQIRQLSLLDLLLEKDFANSNYVMNVDEGIVCNYSGKQVVYSLNNRFIVRSERSVSDTFRVMAQNIQFAYSNKAIEESNRLIDKFSFEHQDKEHLLYFRYRKVYAAEFLMNEEVLSKTNLK